MAQRRRLPMYMAMNRETEVTPMRCSLFVATALLIAGCAPLSGANTAHMPMASYGGPVMNQDEAIGTASWVLLNPGTAAGNPERAARAVAAVDWLAGQTMLWPDYGEYDPSSEYFWRQTRGQVRAALGIAPGAPSQEVVDRMLAAAAALKTGDNAAAAAQFNTPAFSLGGQGTLTALSSLPRITDAEAAFAQLRRNEGRSFGHCGMPDNC